MSKFKSSAASALFPSYLHAAAAAAANSIEDKGERSQTTSDAPLVVGRIKVIINCTTAAVP